MENIFYNIVSILIGLILIYFAFSCLKKKNVALPVLSFIHSVLFLLAGIGGFFLPSNYKYITIFAMLAFCITMLICLLILKQNNKSNEKKTNK